MKCKRTKELVDEWVLKVYGKNPYIADGFVISKENLQDLAQHIWDTATEKERNRKIIAMSGNWKSLDGIIEKRASTQTAKEIFDFMKKEYYDDLDGGLVVSEEDWRYLKKKYLK